MIDRFAGEYHFLSNFYPAKVEMFEVVFPSVEHAYQAAKSQNPRVHQTFAKYETAKQAKQMGKRITNMRPGWEHIKLPIMKILVNRKFNDWFLRDLLLSTGDHELVEGNWWGDTYWGKCNGVGENHLGKILMEIRHNINNPHPGWPTA